MSAENKLALLQDLLSKELKRNRVNPDLVKELRNRIQNCTNQLRGLV